MSNIIRIKRSTSGAAVPASLAFGELAYGAAGDLWIGAADGSIVKIGGVDVATQASVDNAVNYAATLVNDLATSLNNADAYIQELIVAESNARATDISAVYSQLNSVTQSLDSAIQSVNSSLESSISANASYLNNRIDNLEQVVNINDASVRAYVDSNVAGLTSAIDAVAAENLAGLRDLQSAISTETTYRTAAIDEAVLGAKAYTDQKVADLVGQSSGLLDTLQEIGEALGQDPNLATTLLNAIGDEAAARMSADAELQSQINRLTEITVPGLRALITNLESNLNTLVDTNASEHAAINARIEEEHNLIWNTMSRMGAAENAIMSEEIARTEADAAINARIDSLTVSIGEVTLDGGEF